MKDILVQESERETVVAVIESGKLMEAYIEPREDESILGNIYAGVVDNVLPGMQAAFIDIGKDRNAYLYVEDAVSKEELSKARQKGRTLRVEHYVKPGQTVLVQIKKAPSQQKGARVTLDITLPGRYLVFMPLNDYVGISKKINDNAERERLKQVAHELKDPGKGIVVRTVAEGRSREELAGDYRSLSRVWDEIRQAAENCEGKPGLVRADVEFTTRMLRDVIRKDTDRVIVNTQDNLEKVREYINAFIPELQGKVLLRQGPEAWDSYQVQNMLRKALNRKVWLECGAYLIIENTEALTVIDVNTGKFTGKTSLEETAFRVNMEAVKEIARQIRLRNSGGIIIVDFIDQKREEYRRKLVEALEKETAGDSNKVQVVGMTRLGLIEMTRKKSQRSLSHLMEITCPMCRGKGQVLSEENRLKLVEQKIADAVKKQAAEEVVLRANRNMANYLQDTGMRFLQQLEEKYELKILVREDEDLKYDEIHVEGENGAGWY